MRVVVFFKSSGWYLLCPAGCACGNSQEQPAITKPCSLQAVTSPLFSSSFACCLWATRSAGPFSAKKSSSDRSSVRDSTERRRSVRLWHRSRTRSKLFGGDTGLTIAFPATYVAGRDQNTGIDQVRFFSSWVITPSTAVPLAPQLNTRPNRPQILAKDWLIPSHPGWLESVRVSVDCSRQAADEVPDPTRRGHFSQLSESELLLSRSVTCIDSVHVHQAAATTPSCALSKCVLHISITCVCPSCWAYMYGHSTLVWPRHANHDRCSTVWFATWLQKYIFGTFGVHLREARWGYVRIVTPPKGCPSLATQEQRTTGRITGSSRLEEHSP